MIEAKKELKDYLHLYLGCEVIGEYNGEPRKGYLTGVTNGGTECEIQFFEEDGINVFEHPEFNTAETVKLILRPLSDMIEEERAECRKLQPIDMVNTWSHADFLTISEHFLYLLQRGFDLFNLIPEGLAIDSTTVNK